MAQLHQTDEREASRYLELKPIESDISRDRLQYYLTFNALERGSLRYQVELSYENIRSLACACINIGLFVDKVVTLGGNPSPGFIHNKEETHYYLTILLCNRLEFTIMAQTVTFGKIKGQIAVYFASNVATSNWKNSGLVGQSDSFYVLTTMEACRAFGQTLLDEIPGSSMRL